MFEIKAYSQETWPDFEALFGKHKGVRGGCWCTYHLCTSSQFNHMEREARKAFQKALAFQGMGSGLLVYENGTPVAWCQFGPADRFPSYDRMRAYKALALPPDLRPQWRISCLFVDKHRRREGLSKVALGAAIVSIREQGGGLVEAFPMDVPGIKRPHYTGSVEMYRREGFEEVARLGKNTVLMRGWLKGG
jgi:GNAT superfamily N-acetyltransferase